MGELCGHGQAVWPWASCVAAGKPYTAGELYAAGELYVAGELLYRWRAVWQWRAMRRWASYAVVWVVLAQMSQWPTADGGIPAYLGSDSAASFPWPLKTKTLNLDLSAICHHCSLCVCKPVLIGVGEK